MAISISVLGDRACLSARVGDPADRLLRGEWLLEAAAAHRAGTGGQRAGPDCPDAHRGELREGSLDDQVGALAADGGGLREHPLRDR